MADRTIDRRKPGSEPESGVATAATGRGALFVRRPVLAIVLNLLIVVAGLAALTAVEVRELPNIDRPVITIRAAYAGATPESVDRSVTSVIENAVALTPGIKSIASTSSAGQSRITIEFDSAVDIDTAASDLRDAVGRVLPRLPDGVEAPTVVKADADSDAIMRLAVISPALTIEDLTALVQDKVIERLAEVEGVADVQIFGDRSPQVRVIIDPYALAARGLTVSDLRTALSSVAMDAPTGSISDRNRTLLVRADASAKSAAEIASIRVDDNTRVGDVADVLFGPARKVTSIRINGQTGIGLGIVRQAQSNTLAISEGVTEAVADLNALLDDDGVDVIVTSNDAVFIEGALEEVIITLILATLIVVAIIYVFLRSIVVTLIPAVTVPIALAGTVAALYLAGFSINILTLLALVLATGLVVDDAIVVIENIARHRAMGYGARAAAVLGTRQVFFAVISTTATLAAVFIPVSFMPGAAGRLFSEFGFVLAFSVVLSAIIALTLSPMMASRLIGADDRPHTPVGRAVAAVGRGAAGLYGRLLDAALRAPMVVLVVAIVFAAGSVQVFLGLPEELTPPEDRGFVPASVGTPQGATVGYTEDQLRRVERAIQPLVESGEVTSMFVIARGGSSAFGGGFVMLTLAPWEERARSQADITADVNRSLQAIPGVQVFARTSNSLGVRGGGQGLTLSVTGVDYDELADAATRLQAALEADPRFTGARVSYDTTQPQLSIDIDRERAADLGVSVESIATVLTVLLDGSDLGEFYIGGDAIDIRAELPEGMIQDAAALDGIQMRTAGGRMVPLSSLVTVTESAVAPNLPRQDRQRAVPLSADLAPGVDMRSAMNAALAVARSELPPGMDIVFTGEAAQLDEASSGIVATFAFALVIVLLVLAAQFESFASAVILVATVPFGLASAVYAMALSGNSLNIYTEIGLVMLVGLMSKNGILIVEFANQLREEGRSVHEAIREACTIRLRPVVMTMISTVLGGLPLLLRGGAGSEARHALGWIIVGGLGFATLATLFLTPVVYSLLARLSKPRSAETQRLDRELAEAARGGRKPVRAVPPPEELPVAAE